jgi:hypothetical protein
MNDIDFKYHMDNLRALDPDQLISDLNLSTEDILMHFHEEAREFIEKEFG